MKIKQFALNLSHFHIFYIIVVLDSYLWRECSYGVLDEKVMYCFHAFQTFRFKFSAQILLPSVPRGI